MKKVSKEKQNRHIYLKILRSMTFEQRLMKALELSESVRELFKRGLKKRFPMKNEKEIQNLYIQRILKLSNVKKSDIIKILEKIKEGSKSYSIINKQ